jgi:hypothetical protein
MPLWMFVVSFTAGFCTCIGIIAGIILYHLAPIKVPTFTKQRSKPSQLGMEGWIRISNDILPPHFALEHKKDDQRQNWNITQFYESTSIYSTFLISRFLGNQETSVPIQKQVKRPYRDFYAVLQHKTLYLYADELKREFVQTILIPHYHITLTPSTLTDHELFMPHHPILLRVLPNLLDTPMDPQICFYPPTASEKEDWFVTLKRSCSLPLFADQEAVSTFFNDSKPMKNYMEAMMKLIRLTSTGSETDVSASAWLNAFVGRMFVAIHANQTVKQWVMNRLSRHTVETQDEDSFLGAIAIQDIDVGNSLPVLSNPKLVSIAVDGHMLIEMDIDYTGGIRIEAATCATLSVPAWDAYMKPITVPIVVAVKINKFSARVLFKIKSFWETNRIWFGFYRQPELKLELEVEPIISSKLIKIQVVNQVIEQRIKNALDSYLMLPNMDDLSFWDFTDLNGSPFGEDIIPKVYSDVHIHKDHPSFKDHFERDELVNLALMGDAVESTYTDQSQYINNYIQNVGKYAHDFGEPSNPSLPFTESSSETQGFDTQSPISTKSPSYVEYLGNTAYSIGKWSRSWGLDVAAVQIVSSVTGYSKPVIDYVHQQASPLTQLVQNQATEVGRSAIEKLGLKPDSSNSSPTSSRGSMTLDSNVNASNKLKHKSSTNWSLLGLSISTSAPPLESPPSTISRNNRKCIKTIRTMEKLKRKCSKESTFSRNETNHSLFSDIPYQVTDSSDSSAEMDGNDLYMDKSLHILTRKYPADGDSTPRSLSRKASQRH